MKILLTAINAKYIHSNLAVYSLQAYAKAYAGNLDNCEIGIAEYTINQPLEQILMDLYRRKPDVLCFSCYLWNITYTEQLICEIKKVLPKTEIWLGGPEVSWNAMDVLKRLPQVKGIMRGEGEETFTEVVRYYNQHCAAANASAAASSACAAPNIKTSGAELSEAAASSASAAASSASAAPIIETSGAELSEAAAANASAAAANASAAAQNLADIAGITYRSTEASAASSATAGASSGATSSASTAEFYEAAAGIIENVDRPVMKTMDAIPFVYEDLRKFEHKIIYYESSRGCPFSCSYCLSSIDKCLRFRSLELVTRELQFFIDHKVPQVKFVDRTFNCKHDHAMAIWKYLADHDNGVTNFHFEVAADLLNDEEIALIESMRPGLIQLEIGIQSTNDQTIREIKRTMRFEKVKEIVLKIQKKGNIHQHLDLIAGLPYEDYDTFRRSFNDVYALKPEQLQLGFLKVLKGSYMEEMAREYELLYQDRPPFEVLSTKWISYEDVIALKGIEEMVEVHYNSGQFEKTLEKMEALFADAFSMYEALRDYYCENALDQVNHTRISRYEILFAFIKEMTDDVEPFRESLTYDLYLRENVKNRPDFAGEATVDKAFASEFYDKEEQERKYLRGYEKFDKRQMRKMTHLEKVGGRVLLFDYQNRSPLTHQATVYVVG